MHQTVELHVEQSVELYVISLRSSGAKQEWANVLSASTRSAAMAKSPESPLMALPLLQDVAGIME